MALRDISLDGERLALDEARIAAQEKLAALTNLDLQGSDALSEEYMAATVRGAVEKLRQELTVFGRIDDDDTWRIGLYGVQKGTTPVVIDWRAPFAQAFYQARLEAPQGLAQRVSYVGAIDELFIENFTDGSVTGSSPLMAELARSRSETMRTAVATLQAEQDEIVRCDPDDVVVLRGGPGTGKTVIGLHRAAWIVFNDRRLLSPDLILVIGPSDRYLRYVSSVLPSLGEAKIRQTTFDRLLGPTSAIGAALDWPTILDRFEASLIRPQRLEAGSIRASLDDIEALLAATRSSTASWKVRRQGVASRLARLVNKTPKQVIHIVDELISPMTATQAWNKLRSKAVLTSLGVGTDEIEAWLNVPDDGPLRDELRARFGDPVFRYSHVIVDEAQDLTVMQLRAVQRRTKGITLVGDDAQTSAPGAVGLISIAEQLDVAPTEITTAYRMSAEIAAWLNDLAATTGLPAVELVGIRPNGIAVRTDETESEATTRIGSTYENWRTLRAGDVWDHKGVEYDAVVVNSRDMSPGELYLAASRAAHELTVCGDLPWRRELTVSGIGR